jgi:hypothetical protein
MAARSFAARSGSKLSSGLRAAMTFGRARKRLSAANRSKRAAVARVRTIGARRASMKRQGAKMSSGDLGRLFGAAIQFGKAQKRGRAAVGTARRARRTASRIKPARAPGRPRKVAATFGRGFGKAMRYGRAKARIGAARAKGSARIARVGARLGARKKATKMSSRDLGILLGAAMDYGKSAKRNTATMRRARRPGARRPK